MTALIGTPDNNTWDVLLLLKFARRTFDIRQSCPLCLLVSISLDIQLSSEDFPMLLYARYIMRASSVARLRHIGLHAPTSIHIMYVACMYNWLLSRRLPDLHCTLHPLFKLFWVHSPRERSSTRHRVLGTRGSQLGAYARPLADTYVRYVDVKTPSLRLLFRLE